MTDKTYTDEWLREHGFKKHEYEIVPANGKKESAPLWYKHFAVRDYGEKGNVVDGFIRYVPDYDICIFLSSNFNRRVTGSNLDTLLKNTLSAAVKKCIKNPEELDNWNRNNLIHPETIEEALEFVEACTEALNRVNTKVEITL